MKNILQSNPWKVVYRVHKRRGSGTVESGKLSMQFYTKKPVLLRVSSHNRNLHYRKRKVKKNRTFFQFP